MESQDLQKVKNRGGFMFRSRPVCCSTDLGQEYARKLEQLRREEELIHEEELEAEAFADPKEPVAHKVGAQLI